jgi:FkbM family methyltransferase
MPSISVNYNPAMTRYLGEAGYFRDDPVTIIDVGARGGFRGEWGAFGAALKLIGFEPEETECARLNADAPSNVRYLPVALGRQNGSAVLYEAQLNYSSGLYRTNMEYFSRLLNRANGEVVGEHVISVSTLDTALERAGIPSADFIKLDAEGAELDILEGAPAFVGNPGLIGIFSEFRFQEEINGCPIFWQLDSYVRRFGFHLYGLGFSHQSRHVLPYGGLPETEHMRYTALPKGLQFFAATTHGQIMDGDALYFRDLLIPANAAVRQRATPIRLLKTAAFLELYCLSDCAAEVILAHREILAPVVDCDRLLDLLTPAFRGVSVGYNEYMKAYFQPDTAPVPPPPVEETWDFDLLSHHVRAHLRSKRGDRIVCFGAGSDFRRLVEAGVFRDNPIVAVVDNIRHPGETVSGVPVVRETDLANLDFDMVVATSARVGPQFRAQAALWAMKSFRDVPIV